MNARPLSEKPAEKSPWQRWVDEERDDAWNVAYICITLHIKLKEYYYLQDCGVKFLIGHAPDFAISYMVPSTAPSRDFFDFILKDRPATQVEAEEQK